MSEEPTCDEKHAAAPAMVQPVRVGDGGGLADVFVYVKEGLGDMTFATPTTAAILDQDGCEYQPHVVGEFDSPAPASISTADASSLTWYNFTPFGLDGNAPGVAAIGSQASITMDNIVSVGYFFETENTHATDNKWVGSKLLYFSVTATGYNPDINDDGSVDLKDFAKLAIWWENNQCETFVDCLDADINSDGIVDIMDVKIVTQRWLDSD